MNNKKYEVLGGGVHQLNNTQNKPSMNLQLFALEYNKVDNPSIITLTHPIYIKGDNIEWLVDLSDYASSKITDYDTMTTLPDTTIAYLNQGFKATSMYQMFNGCSALTTIPKFDTDTTKNTSIEAMFKGCSSLESVDLSWINTDGCDDFSDVFNGCSFVIELDVSDWDTQKVRSFASMFKECSSLSSLDLSNFDTTKATNIGSMFSGCSQLSSIILGSKFNTSLIKDFSYLFQGDSSLTIFTFDKTSFVGTSATNISGMFEECSGLTSIDLSGFNAYNIVSANYTFQNCSNVETIDISGIDTSTIQNFKYIFDGCSSLTTINGVLDMKSAVNYKGMFGTCPNLKGLKVKNPPADFQDQTWIGSSQFTVVS